MGDAIALFRAKQAGYLPDHLAIDWEELRNGFARGFIDVGKRHLAPNGYLHAATVVALADTACGYGCVMSAAEGAAGFTTLELKPISSARRSKAALPARRASFTVGARPRSGTRRSKAKRRGKTIALFRCTQMLLAKPRGDQ